MSSFDCIDFQSLSCSRLWTRPILVVSSTLRRRVGLRVHLVRLSLELFESRLHRRQFEPVLKSRKKLLYYSLNWYLNEIKDSNHQIVLHAHDHGIQKRWLAASCLSQPTGHRIDLLIRPVMTDNRHRILELEERLSLWWTASKRTWNCEDVSPMLSLRPTLYYWDRRRLRCCATYLVDESRR